MAENTDSTAPPPSSSSFMEKIAEKLHFHDSDDQKQHEKVEKNDDEVVEKVQLKEEKHDVVDDHSSSSSSSSSSSDDESEKHKTTSDDSSSVKNKISRLFGREKPVHQVLGGGKPADVFLWRNKKISASVLGIATVIWILFELLEYHLLTLVCHILIFSLAVLFLWANATNFINKSPPHFPELSLPEQPFLQAAGAMRYELNRAFALLHDIAVGKDLKKFLAVIAGLWFLSIVGKSCDFLTLFYINFVLLHTLPVLYEKHEEKVDKFVEKALSSPPWPHHLSPSYQTPPFHSAPHHHFRQQRQQQPPPLRHLRLRNGFDPNRRIDPFMNLGRSGPPPGFLGNNPNRNRNHGDLHNVGREMSSSSELGNNFRGFSGSNGKNNVNERRFLRHDDDVVGFGGELSRQIDHPGLPAGSAHRSVLGSDVEQSLNVLHGGRVDDGVGRDEVDELSEQLVDSVLDDEPLDDKSDLSAKKKHPRDKDFRSDARGKWILPQRTRNSKRMIECRRDIHRLSTPFLAIYKSLIPAEEEKLKQKRLMALLEKLVCKEWPDAKLFIYGSCADSFGVSKSDIDVSLAIDDREMDKSEILLKLADILQSDNLENVQALTRARVPIVKLMDPVTGISCDICINNVLAVVNTKLLRDYAQIDVRLRQLAFLVKHWAKSRGVNETYQGTLSSYAYVLMCIHFLQQRNPPILPCLQGMKATYSVTVDHIECSFFDQVEKLRNFGAHNKENIAQLMWAFFSYWAYCHDYANTVISVRTGTILSKHEKDWTRRVGNDSHLICIEDPFEVTHDLGRVVDKHSIRVLREEFERAARIMQYDPNPCVSLFEPYVPAP